LMSSSTTSNINECQADRGMMVVDEFSSDTLMVTRSFPSGDITARSRNHQELRINCGDYEILY